MERFNQLKIKLIERLKELEKEMCRLASEGEVEKVQKVAAKYEEAHNTLKSMNDIVHPPVSHLRLVR